MNIPWSGLSTSLAPDLYKYQSSSLGNQSDPLDLHHLSASDGSIHASFIGLGASIQSLMVKDRSGSFRDIVLGYDNISQYLHDPAYPRFGSIVGRYANRIKNSTFTLSGRDKRTYKVTPNEHNDQNTLHGGKPGWDRRPFDVQNKSLSQITFSIVDPNGEQGFPNQVVGKIEYELLPGAKWRTRMTGVADGFTPIMLSSHVYWNLDAYAANSSASDHLIQMNAPSYIVTDGNLIPTGEIASVAKTALDFNQSRTIGSLFDQTKGLCGTGCIGYANTVMEMWSEASGIKMSVITDQSSAQIYTCNAIEPIDSSIRSIPRKSSHHGPNAIYENHSCVVIEQQSFIDGINNPQWGLNQIYGPDRPYEWNSIYHFTTL
ncbi:galactose mutarotase-like domain-containing protein [Melampsora americana]|nr:galactose mutarotase-like domain-containing protein [Melampsora americana]